MVNNPVKAQITFFSSALSSGLVVLFLALASAYMVGDKSLLLLGLKPFASVVWCFLGVFQVAFGAIIGLDYARLSNMSLSPYRYLPAIIGAFFAAMIAPAAFMAAQLTGLALGLVYVLNVLLWMLLGLIILCFKE